MNIKFLTVRTIFENDSVTIDDLSYILTVEKCKIENAINDAINDSLIVKKGHYQVTEKGIEYLSKYRVDNAIILACGKGMRLAPLTFDTPKSFIRIKGQKLIERQIEQLLVAGIKDITIMVGYMSEKFSYLKHKYGVKIIYNEEYDNKNTLATLYHAIKELKNHNTYVCVSDVYMVNNIFHKYECENYYCGTFLHDLNKEWQYVRDDDNRITGVLDGGTDEYAMMGPSFLTKEFSDKLINLIIDAYKKDGTEKWYWENVLVDNFLNLPPMYLYKQIKGSMYEFDKLSDIKLFDTDIKTGSFSFSFIADMLGILEKDIKNINLIKEGMTNRSYTFIVDSAKIKKLDKSLICDKYICRVPGIGTNFFINRKNEKEVYEKLDKYNITEKIIGFDDDGVKISNYFDNCRIVNIEDETELRDTMSFYRIFHNIGEKVKQISDPKYKIDEYVDIINKYNIDTSIFKDYKVSLEKVNELSDFVKRCDRPQTIIQGDANPGNVLKTKDGYKLIDFEYAGMADPLNDIALFGTYIGYDIDKIYKLFAYYNDNDNFEKVIKDNNIYFISDKNQNIALYHQDGKIYDMEILKKLLLCYISLNAFWGVVWTICKKGLSGIEYSEYGPKMQNIFEVGYNEFKNVV